MSNYELSPYAAALLNNEANKYYFRLRTSDNDTDTVPNIIQTGLSPDKIHKAQKAALAYRDAALGTRQHRGIKDAGLYLVEPETGIFQVKQTIHALSGNINGVVITDIDDLFSQTTEAYCDFWFKFFKSKGIRNFPKLTVPEVMSYGGRYDKVPDLVAAAIALGYENYDKFHEQVIAGNAELHANITPNKEYTELLKILAAQGYPVAAYLTARPPEMLPVTAHNLAINYAPLAPIICTQAMADPVRAKVKVMDALLGNGSHPGINVLYLDDHIGTIKAMREITDPRLTAFAPIVDRNRPQLNTGINGMVEIADIPAIVDQTPRTGNRTQLNTVTAGMFWMISHWQGTGKDTTIYTN